MAISAESRQKLLLVILALVVAYAAFDYFYMQGGSGSGTSRKNSVRASYEKNVKDLMARVSKGALNAVGLHKVRMAGDSLKSLPMYESEGPFYLAGRQSESFSTQVEGQEVVYSGFVELGGVRLALLNGVEYAEGDAFIIDGYRVTQIADQFVILVKSAESGIPGARVKVPMAEEEDSKVNIRVVE